MHGIKSSTKYSLGNSISKFIKIVADIIASKSLKTPQTSTLRSHVKPAVTNTALTPSYEGVSHHLSWLVDVYSRNYWDDFDKMSL